MRPFSVFQPPGVVVGTDEVGQVCFELIVSIVMIALDGGFLDCAVHALDLTIGPGMLDLGQPMFDPVLLAARIGHMRRVSCGRAVGVARRESELDPKGSDAGMTASDAGWSAAAHRGSHRAAVAYAAGKRR